MITFEYRFDVLPGKLRDYRKYTQRAGKNVWSKRPGVLAVRAYRNMLGGSPPQRVVQIDLESLAALEKIFNDPGFQKVKEEFHSLVTNVRDSLLVAAEEKK
jgi:hypothetical protein